MFRKPDVKIIRRIDTSDVLWTDDAVIVSVKNGKGTLTHITDCGSECYSDARSHLKLNDITLVQGQYPFCPTCHGLLASGYGLENVKCRELDTIRRTVNEDFSGTAAAAERLMPLLRLLDDGYYLIADVTHYPTDGNGSFFYNMSNKLSYYDGCCDCYYIHEMYYADAAYPAFLIPTQSADLISRERVEYYKKKLISDPESVRCIAYHEKGFYSALLDGHHKAFAAAELALPIKCITIIPGYVYQNKNFADNSSETGIEFCDIHIKEDNSIRPDNKCKPQSRRNTVDLFESSVAGRSFDISCIKYPNAWDLAVGYALNDTDIDTIISDYDKEDCTSLKIALKYYQKNSLQEARKLALKIINSQNTDAPVREAWRTLLNFRDNDTEQLFIDYLINNDRNHIAYDIVNSYWD